MVGNFIILGEALLDVRMQESNLRQPAQNESPTRSVNPLAPGRSWTDHMIVERSRFTV